MEYDSSKDTLLHIKRVNELLSESAINLIRRGNVHDNSKLQEPEKSEFDRLTPKLKSLVYGTPEYQESLNELQVALRHHYANNSHHPEHYENGIDDMDLFDLIEMFCDWKAACERTKDGDIYKSIEINKKRFGMSDQLCNIFRNTAFFIFKDDDLKIIIKNNSEKTLLKVPIKPHNNDDSVSYESRIEISSMRLIVDKMWFFSDNSELCYPNIILGTNEAMIKSTIDPHITYTNAENGTCNINPVHLLDWLFIEKFPPKSNVEIIIRVRNNIKRYIKI